MQTWAYRLETVEAGDDEGVLARLNELGSQGWECFHIEAAPGFGRRLRCWLKRAGRPVDPSEAEID